MEVVGNVGSRTNRRNALKEPDLRNTLEEPNIRNTLEEPDLRNTLEEPESYGRKREIAGCDQKRGDRARAR